jgi:hypothetical protein
MFRLICSHNQAERNNKNRHEMFTAAREVGDEYFVFIFIFAMNMMMTI